MKKKHLLILALLISVGSYGCAKADDSIAVANDSRNVSTNNFQQNIEGAKRFWEMRETAQKLHEQGKYKESLDVMEDAYKNFAYGRSEKTIALQQMASTYEVMQNYEFAANFYEGAAKMTMNPAQAEEFSKKATELRKSVKA